MLANAILVNGNSRFTSTEEEVIDYIYFSGQQIVMCAASQPRSSGLRDFRCSMQHAASGMQDRNVQSVAFERYGHGRRA